MALKERAARDARQGVVQILEDVTRDPDADDATVAGAKRAIDCLNLARHDLVERIDAAVDDAVEQSPTAPMATESPGMVVDRLSVLVIRLARMTAASELAPDGDFDRRLAALRAQIDALSEGLDTYLDELVLGRRRFLPYEHLKLYRP